MTRDPKTRKFIVSTAAAIFVANLLVWVVDCGAINRYAMFGASIAVGTVMFGMILLCEEDPE